MPLYYVSTLSLSYLLLHLVSRKNCAGNFSNNFVKRWPILIIRCYKQSNYDFRILRGNAATVLR